MRLLVLALALAACGHGRPRRAPADDTELAVEATARLRDRHPTWSVAPIGPRLLIIAEPSGATWELSLDEVSRRCQTPKACDLALEDLMARVAPGGLVVPRTPTAPVVPGEDPGVTAVLRAKNFLPAEGWAGVVHRPLVPGGPLEVVYLIGAPPSSRHATPADLTRLRVDLAGLDALVRQSLAARLPPLPTEPPATIGVLASGHELEAARLLLEDPWRALAARMTGPLLVSAPGADTLLYADGGNPTALPALRTLADDMRRRVLAPLPPAVFAWSDAGWTLVP